MMLDQCRNDFQSLIDRIQLHAAFEKADSKDRYVHFIDIVPSALSICHLAKHAC